MSAAAKNWRLGLIYAGITASAWGILPIALKALLVSMDPFTITWYRFVAAAALTALFLQASGGMPRLRQLDRRGWALLIVAAGGLTGN
ncbi:MAG: EamA family transporter [Gammaproteobacteria bacterium]